MTAQEVRLCGLLLQEHFGDVVENVGTHLIRNGVLTLRALAHETKLALDLVISLLKTLFDTKNMILRFIHHLLSLKKKISVDVWFVRIGYPIFPKIQTKTTI